MRHNPDPYVNEARRAEAYLAIAELQDKLRTGQAKLSGNVRFKGCGLDVSVTLDDGLPVIFCEKGPIVRSFGSFDDTRIFIYHVAGRRDISEFDTMNRKALFVAIAGLFDDRKFENDFMHEYTHYHDLLRLGQEHVDREFAPVRQSKTFPEFEAAYAASTLEHSARLQSAMHEADVFLGNAYHDGDFESVYGALKDFDAFLSSPFYDAQLKREFSDPSHPLYQIARQELHDEYDRLRNAYASSISEGQRLSESPKEDLAFSQDDIRDYFANVGAGSYAKSPTENKPLFGPMPSRRGPGGSVKRRKK